MNRRAERIAVSVLAVFFQAMKGLAILRDPEIQGHGAVLLASPFLVAALATTFGFARFGSVLGTAAGGALTTLLAFVLPLVLLAGWVSGWTWTSGPQVADYSSAVTVAERLGAAVLTTVSSAAAWWTHRQASRSRWEPCMVATAITFVALAWLLTVIGAGAR
jgi:hypothetical protein